MTLFEIRKGDSISINGVEGIVAGMDFSSERAVFLDVEPNKQLAGVFLPAFHDSEHKHL